ncbi:MAG: hypothetical protein H6916_01755 [Novosphingobium sp.]|nr:hypothetical protein [Novosphingobium sp.]MCP5385530.1 hypothetical protein [Novosphingobium sp.]
MMRVVRIAALPADPLGAAAAFHAHWLPSLRASDGDLLIAFPPAGHMHRMWRVAATQELARESAPNRVNSVATMDHEGIAAALALLADCQGITGQYLVLDQPAVLLPQQ